MNATDNRPRLVHNETAVSTKRKIQSLTINVLPKLVRHDTMEDRNFLVVPMVILTEGVHNGSEGPLYYPPSELGKTPAAWNHKPVVVYHPTLNGAGISACDPAIISTRKVGVMMNTRFEKGKLKSEAWIEESRANKVDERIMEAVQNGSMMEVSTGVFVDEEPTEGEWNGESYVAIARNYRPDHLALLPDTKGACSIEDGAGFLRNSEGPSSDYLVVEDPEESSTWHLRVRRNGAADHNLMGAAWAALHSGYRGNKYQGPNKSAALKKLKALYKKEGMDMPTSNEMSFSNIGSALGEALNKKFPPAAGETFNRVWVMDVYPGFVVYEKDNKLFKIGYTASDTGVSLSDETPAEVVRVTEYRTVEGTFVGNDQTNKKTETGMEKKNIVDAIILAAAALAGGWSEADRETLMAMNQDQLTLIQNRVGKSKEAPKQEEPKKETPKQDAAQPTANKETPKQEESKKMITLEEYIDSAPAPMRDVLKNSLAMHDEEKQRLISVITANKNNGFTKADLEHRPLGELRNLARLAAGETSTTRTVDYSGQGNTPASNSGAEEEALEMPTMNFEKASK